MNPIALALALVLPNTVLPIDGPTVIVVVGAEGTEEYGKQFVEWADRWQAAAKSGNARCFIVGSDQGAETTDKDCLRGLLNRKRVAANGALWLILIGHGTFDGRQAKFNLRGPDVSAAELAEWLEPIERSTAIINCASASAPFINRLSKDRRVVVTATKSGQEQNFARFGDFLSQAITDSKADLDRDGQTSLLEAFLAASRQTEEFYKLEGRLATEHALLDDSGDKRGTRADGYRGVRPLGTPDGYRAHQWHLVPSPAEQRLTAEQRRRRDELELAVVSLRGRKAELGEDAYFAEFERLMLAMAAVYEGVESPIRHASFERPVKAPLPR